MSAGNVQWSPTVAAAASGSVKALLLSGQAPAQIVFSRAAELEWFLGCQFAAEAALNAAKVSGAPLAGNTFGQYDDIAYKAFNAKGLNFEADVTQGVPANIAASACYLATLRAMKKAKGATRSSSVAATVNVNHEVTVPGLPSGDTGGFPIPSLPIPPFTVPGAPNADPAGTVTVPGIGTFPAIPIVVPGPASLGLDFGAIPLAVGILVVGVIGVIAAAWTVESVEAEKSKQETARVEVEQLSKVQLATELCAAQAAAGQPCDVPKVVASLARDEKRDHDLYPWLIGAGVIAAAGVAYLVYTEVA